MDSVHGKRAAFWMFVLFIWVGGVPIGREFVSLVTVSWYPLDPPQQTISREI